MPHPSWQLGVVSTIGICDNFKNQHEFSAACIDSSAWFLVLPLQNPNSEVSSYAKLGHNAAIGLACRSTMGQQRMILSLMMSSLSFSVLSLVGEHHD